MLESPDLQDKCILSASLNHIPQIEVLFQWYIIPLSLRALRELGGNAPGIEVDDGIKF
jgi:hypothetical protein